jgi:hypothetical protein
MKQLLCIFLLALFGGMLYFATLRGVPGNIQVSSIKNNLDQATKPFELSPERGRFLMTMALGEYGTFDLTSELADAAYPDVGYFRGRYYIFFAPGISMFALPTYVLGRYFGYSQLGAYAIIPLFAVMNLIFLYKIAKDIFKLPTTYSLIAPIIFGFASTAWSYAITLYQHHATTFFILSSFYAAWRFSKNTRYSYVWGFFIWVNYALALLIDYPNAFLMAPVMVYFFLQSFSVVFNKGYAKVMVRWSFLFTAVVFVLITAWHGYYNYVNFGDWKKVSGSIIGLKTVRQEQLLTSENSAEKLKAAESEKNVVKFFSENNFPFGVYTLLVSSDRGIFFYYPIFILALFGIYTALKRMTMEYGTLIGIICCDVFLYASFGDPWGGWAFGSRYMIPALSALSLFVALWLFSTRFRITSKIVSFVFFAFSSGVALLGALTTNAVPPQVEADYLHMKHNFFLNLQFLQDGRSSSFFYNQFLSHSVSLTAFYVTLYAFVLGMFGGLLVWSYMRTKYVATH